MKEGREEGRKHGREGYLYVFFGRFEDAGKCRALFPSTVLPGRCRLCLAVVVTTAGEMSRHVFPHLSYSSCSSPLLTLSSQQLTLIFVSFIASVYLVPSHYFAYILPVFAACLCRGSQHVLRIPFTWSTLIAFVLLPLRLVLVHLTKYIFRYVSYVQFFICSYVCCLQHLLPSCPSKFLLCGYCFTPFCCLLVCPTQHARAQGGVDAKHKDALQQASRKAKRAVKAHEGERDKVPRAAIMVPIWCRLFE